MPGKLKFVINQGATFRRKFTYKTNTDTVDLTGAKIIFEIAPADLSAKKTYSTETGHISIEDGDEGKFILRIPPTITADYTWQSGRYNLNVEFPSGDVVRLLEGGISVSRRV